VSGTLANQIGAQATSDGQSLQLSAPTLGPLANAENAIISPDKIFGYSLNPDNPRGSDKAVVFDSALGYNQSNGLQLVEAIRSGIATNMASFYAANQFGVQFRIDMPIFGPNGNTRVVRTGWIYDTGSDRPRLVTAFVLDKEGR
jgi:uncharacterized protein